MLINRDALTLDDLIQVYIEKTGLHEEYELALIINNWAELVGEKFAEVSKPDTLKNGVLTTRCCSSVWRTELFMRRQQIIDKINDYRNKEVIKSMVIR